MKRLLLFSILAALMLPLFAQEEGAELPHLQPMWAVGDKAPVFAGLDQNGNRIISKEMAMDGPLVVVFYRGAWCGYCTAHVAELQKELEAIDAKNARVILITPEQPEYAKQTLKEANASFSVLTDADHKIMRSFGVAFKITEETVPRFYESTLKNTRKVTGTDADILPVPATFVLNKKHVIEYMHFDPDYRKRSSVADIIEALQ